MMLTLQETHALAEAAATSAREAHDKAETALSGLRELHEDFGGVAAEVSGLTRSVEDMRSDVKGLERLLREALPKVAQVAVQAKREARKSHHDLEGLREDIEDSKVTHLRGELQEVTSRYLSVRARDKAVLHWAAGIVSVVVAGLTLAWLAIKLGLKP